MASTLVAVGVLAFAGTASATVFTPVDGPALNAAVNSANANPGRDTILLLANGVNAVYLPTAPLNITDDLTIAKGLQTGSSLPPKIDGGFQAPPTADRITIAAGADVTIRTVTLTSLGDGTAGQSSIRNNGGTLKLEDVSLGGNEAVSLDTEAGSTTTVNNSTLSDNSGTPGVQANGPITFNNSTITRNVGGILGTAAYTLNNTAVLQNLVDCAEATAAASTGSADSDGSCAVQATTAETLGPLVIQGGPTSTSAPQPGSALIDTADQSICPTIDQRYFVRTGPCDIGAYEVGAAADTTAPTCAVTALRAGPPKQQDVTAQDGGSGLEPGQSPTTTGFPASTGAFGTADTGPAGAIGGIDNIRITNGTVAFTPFAPFNWTPFTGTHPDRRPLVVTATKTNQAAATQWSFTAKDIAGNVTHCQ